MADSNIAVTAGSGTLLDTRTEGTNSEHRQCVVIADPATNAGVAPVDSTNGLTVNAASAASSIAANEDTASADGDRGVKVLAVQKATPANTAGTDGDYEFLQMSAGKLWVAPLGFPVTVSTDVTRPADTNAYTANDAWSDSTSAPTSGGFTFTSAARKSGGSGIITDAIITSSNVPATLLQGGIWLFDTSVTNINDNAAFAVSDSEIKTCVGRIPFSLESAGNNSFAHVQNLAMGFTCSGSANLRFLIRVVNGYTPASSEVLTVRLKILQID